MSDLKGQTVAIDTAPLNFLPRPRFGLEIASISGNTALRPTGLIYASTQGGAFGSLPRRRLPWAMLCFPFGEIARVTYQITPTIRADPCRSVANGLSGG